MRSPELSASDQRGTLKLLLSVPRISLPFNGSFNRPAIPEIFIRLSRL
jgi:hypothetical protein